MKKVEIQEEIPFEFQWTVGVPLKKIKDDIEELEKLGVDEIYIESLEDLGSTYTSIKAYHYRPETEEEYELRIKKIQEEEEYWKQQEIKLYNQLKLKHKL